MRSQRVDTTERLSVQFSSVHSLSSCFIWESLVFCLWLVVLKFQLLNLEAFTKTDSGLDFSGLLSCQGIMATVLWLPVLITLTISVLPFLISHFVIQWATHFLSSNHHVYINLECQQQSWQSDFSYGTICPLQLPQLWQWSLCSAFGAIITLLLLFYMIQWLFKYLDMTTRQPECILSQSVYLLLQSVLSILTACFFPVISAPGHQPEVGRDHPPSCIWQATGLNSLLRTGEKETPVSSSVISEPGITLPIEGEIREK